MKFGKQMLRKKFFNLFVLASLACPAIKAWDKKDTALAIAAGTVIAGGELIRRAVIHRDTIKAFLKDRPHVAVAGVIVLGIATRQLHKVMYAPIREWWKTPTL